MAVQLHCEDVWSFKHDPLQNQSTDIRLIRLLPASKTCYLDTIQPIIECEIFHVSRMDPKICAYKALSYAWGSSRDTSPCIFINNKSYHTQRNLFEALAQFQTELQSDESLIIWIDALCIDQSNLDEKSAQVMKMRDIYVAANEVIIWLGRSTKRTATAVAFMRSIAPPYLDNALEFRRQKSAEFSAGHISDAKLVLQKALSGESDEFWGFIELVDRSYWDRIWVVQEYLAARRAIIRCGKERFLPVFFLRLCELMANPFGTTAIPIDPNTKLKKQIVCAIDRVMDLQLFIIKMEGCIERCRESPSTRLLYDSLIVQWSKQATDPRDKVFALVGIWDAYMGRRFTPNYNWSTSRVYCELVQWAIDSDKTFNIWSFLQDDTPKVQGLPSWAIDWSAVNIKDSQFAIRFSEGVTTQRNVSRARVSFHHCTGTMTAKGWDLGTIDRISENDIYRGDLSIFKENHQICAYQNLLQFVQLLGVIEPNEEKRLETLAQLLNTICPFPVSHDAFTRILTNAIRLAQAGDYKAVAMAAIESMTFPVSDDDHGSPRTEWLIARLNIASHRIAYNSMSATFALVPGSTQKSDLFFQPFGSWFPVVIRPVPGRNEHQVIGPCTLDGFMSGEAFHLHRQGKLRVCEYTFC